MNENWYEINYWDLDGEWRGCPNCNECDGEIPENDVHFYIDDFENKKKLNLFKKEIICFGRELLRQSMLNQEKYKQNQGKEDL